jgi:hypothetical protein
MDRKFLRNGVKTIGRVCNIFEPCVFGLVVMGSS